MPIPSKRTKETSHPRVNAQAAGYMELEGAVKDGDCSVVEVQNGISKERGCCNLWSDKGHAKAFKCGTCRFER